MCGMPHWLIQRVPIAGWVLAGLLGCVCFYLAFFLYEDEEGVWQNRIENLRMLVYASAKVTNSTSAALLNRVAEILKRAYIHLFSERLLSFQSIAVSMNLSLAGLTFTRRARFDWLTRANRVYIYSPTGSTTYGSQCESMASLRNLWMARADLK